VSGGLRTLRLLGAQHVALGAIDGLALADIAIALSRGGAPKPYDHAEPNEDAAGFALGAGGALLVVADGHDGAHGAEAVVAHLLDAVAPSACDVAPPVEVRAGESRDEAWCDWLYSIVSSANAHAIADAQARRLPPAPTTLAFALARPSEDVLACACVGDSHVLAARGGEVRDLGWASLGAHEFPHFLGTPEESWHRANTALCCVQLAGIEALALATDGLSEQGIGVVDPTAALADALRAARGIEVRAVCRAQRAARELVEIALSAQRRNRRGDNVAVALLAPASAEPGSPPGDE